MRRTLVIVGIILLLGIAGLAALLGEAHWRIRALDPPLPAPEALRKADGAADLPIRIRWINTASQPMPRAGVLEPSLDPEPDAPYVMSHPSFVLEWDDGRLFLVDLGMDRDAALQFGSLIESVMGGEAIEPLGSAAEQLGSSASRVAGVGLTHLHEDHAAGARALCDALPGSVPLFQAPLQFGNGNYTTRAGSAHLERAGCIEAQELRGGPVFEVPGFPGLSVIQAAGHTPGSQVFVARVRTPAAGAEAHTWILAGDLANHVEGVRRNLPKPHLYSLLVVPESTGRLERLRRWLSSLEAEHGARLLLAHDQLHLEATGIPAWAEPAG